MSHSRRPLLGRLLESLPTAAVSRVVGRLCRLRVPVPARGPAWRLAAAGLGIDLSEAAEPAESFACFDDFFTRRLRSGAREVSHEPGLMAAPADGRLTDLGAVGGPVLVKQRQLELADWLGRAQLPFEKAVAAVVYLSPRNYHRVHSPVAGVIVSLTYTPGRLAPVNPRLAGSTGRVFGTNERVTCWIDSPYGLVGVALIGALGVGSIELSFHPLRTNARAARAAREVDLRARCIRVRAGDELGVFHMGSTVVTVWSGVDFALDPSIRPPGPIRVGRVLGRWSACG